MLSVLPLVLPFSYLVKHIFYFHKTTDIPRFYNKLASLICSSCSKFLLWLMCQKQHGEGRGVIQQVWRITVPGTAPPFTALSISRPYDRLTSLSKRLVCACISLFSGFLDRCKTFMLTTWKLEPSFYEIKPKTLETAIDFQLEFRLYTQLIDLDEYKGNKCNFIILFVVYCEVVQQGRC